jgi:hypothetical protein
MFHLSLRSANHVRHYSIVPTDRAGWEVTLEEDRMLRRHDLYQDWHRVERALALFEREVSELTEQGWRVAPEEPVPDEASR